MQRLLKTSPKHSPTERLKSTTVSYKQTLKAASQTNYEAKSSPHIEIQETPIKNFPLKSPEPTSSLFFPSRHTKKAMDAAAAAPPAQQTKQLPLTELSPNTTSPTKSSSTTTELKFRAADVVHNNNKNTSTTYHHHHHNENAAAAAATAEQKYVSPSDHIMSPTTKKLSAIKGKRFGAARPQSLFAKTVGKQAAMGMMKGGEEKLGAGGAAAPERVSKMEG